MKIVVLAGGLSGERNVSLSSGTMICEALRRRGHQVALVDLFTGLEGREGEDPFEAPVPEEWRSVGNVVPDLNAVKRTRADQSGTIFGLGVVELCRQADIAFLALHGGCGEDGRIQAALEMLGIPYTGSDYRSSAIAMDKDLTKKLVAPAGVVTPEWEIWNYSESEIEKIAASVPLPCVVKPIDGGSSIGVSIARSAQELRAALRLESKNEGRCVLEKYITGREIQVAVLDGKALPSIEIIPSEGFYDYRNKYQPGTAEEICPARIPRDWEERLRAAAERVYQILGLSVYARADFIVTEDGTPYFLEINNLPGMTPTSLVPQEASAAGISYEELCERIIQVSLRVRQTVG